MSYQEFCIQVAPLVKEIEEECRKMTLEEFLDFRQEIMEAVVVRKDLSKRFMASVLGLIQKRVFREESVNKTAY